MPVPRTTVLLDSNIYDKLAVDAEVRDAISESCERGRLRVIAAATVEAELAESPHGGIPDWFSVEVIADSVFILDYSRLGAARLGEGRVYSEHLGASQKIPDAVLADSADLYADILVSEDRRCRQRLRTISSRCLAFDYGEFVAWLRGEGSG